MAKAKVYFGYDKEGSDWQGPYGEGESAQSDGNTSADHAERVAWREAQKELKSWHARTKAGFAGHKVRVKIWVDQLVCPSCQLWMIVGVLSNLASFDFKPTLFVEVKTARETRITGAISRHYVWPVSIGHVGVETLRKLKDHGVTLDE